MRQTLMFAAIHMLFSIGVRQNFWKLSSKLDCSEDTIKEEFSQYIEPATEMFEIAEEMAMDKPQSAESNYYSGIAHWWASHCRENGKFPEREDMLFEMAEMLGRVFDQTLSHTQREALAKRLKDFT